MKTSFLTRKTPYVLIFFIALFFNLNAQVITKEYLADSVTNFPNPERGFAPSIDPPWPTTPITWGFQECDGYTYEAWTAALNLDSLKIWRTRSHSLVMIRYHIAEFRNIELSEAFISRLFSDFKLVRKAGFKLIPRFVYNWPMGGPDASVDMVLKHIEQLKPVFAENADVIHVVEFGFIGCWGEQHHSCHGLVDGMWEPNDKTWQIHRSLFQAVPKERMIMVRYPFWKFRYFGSGISDAPTSPLQESEAYTGSIKSRWGHMDDCLVCGEWNVGTWNNNRSNAQEVIDFLAQDNRYVIQGGEPGDPGTETDPNDSDKDGYVYPHHTSCDRMRWLLKKTHWSYVNVSYGNKSFPAANTAWINGGCYDEIARSLGYRFRLVQSQIPLKVFQGGIFSMSFIVCNDGWAAPHNPRGLEIVLRNRASGELHRLNITDGKGITSDHSHDPRFWQGGENVRVDFSVNLPQDVCEGVYEVLLNLYDPLLYGRPEYSIRLANHDLWESSTGYNKFMMQMDIIRN